MHTDVGDVIRARRRMMGLTQAALAKRSGVSKDTISRIENGQHNVRLNTLEAIAGAMGLRAVHLLDLVDPDPEEQHP